MKKCIYAIYDEAVKGIPGDLFTDFNDETIKRGLQQQQETKPISRDMASDLVLLRLGSIDLQSDITDIKIDNECKVVAKFTDFLTFTKDNSNA